MCSSANIILARWCCRKFDKHCSSPSRRSCMFCCEMCFSPDNVAEEAALTPSLSRSLSLSLSFSLSLSLSLYLSSCWCCHRMNSVRFGAIWWDGKLGRKALYHSRPIVCRPLGCVIPQPDSFSLWPRGQFTQPTLLNITLDIWGCVLDRITSWKWILIATITLCDKYRMLRLFCPSIFCLDTKRAFSPWDHFALAPTR